MVENMLGCEDMVMVWAENQEWDDATLNQLKNITSFMNAECIFQ